MSSEELGSLRLKLHEHCSNAPARLDQIKDYLEKWQDLVKQIEGLEAGDRDVQESRTRLAELESLHQLNQRAHTISTLLNVAKGEELNIEKADRAYREATDLFSRISNAGETGARETATQYSDLATQLFNTVLDLRDGSRQHREKAYEETGRWTTVRGESRKEDLEKWLTELFPHVRVGRRVPYDRALLGEKIVQNIEPDEDQETIPAPKLARLIRDALKGLCTEQAERLYNEALAKLLPDDRLKEVDCQSVNLKEARKRFEAGKEYTSSADGATHHDPGLQIWRDEYEQLEQKLGQLEKQEVEAAGYITQALALAAEEGLFQSLIHLQTARTIHPCLDLLDSHTVVKLKLLKVHLKKLVENGEQEVKEACGKREYNTAFKEIKGTEGEIEKYAPLIPEALARRPDVQLDLKSMKRELEKSRAHVNDEQTFWAKFKDKKETLETQLKEGSIQAGDLEEVKKRFTDAERKLFAAEWGEIELKLTTLQSDQGKLDTARSKDITDGAIESIVQGISTSSGMYQDAQQWLFQHYLAKHRKALADMLVDGTILTDSNWKAKGQRHYEEASRYGRQIKPEPDETLQAVKTLWDAVRKVWSLKVETNNKEFAKNKGVLDSAIQNASVEVKQALNKLLDDLLSRWHQDLWAFIDNLIERDTLRLKKSNKLKEGLQKVKLLETELVGLIEEGDPRVFEAVKYYWHEERLLAAIGFQKGQSYQSPSDAFWHNLEPENLWEIRDHAIKVTRDSAVPQRQISEAEAVALFQTSSGYLALNQPRDEALENLKEQREADNGRLKPDLLQCALLIWRQLEKLPDGLKEAKGIIDELRHLGPYTRETVGRLEKLCEVHQSYVGGKVFGDVVQGMQQAIQEFEDGTGSFWVELKKASDGRIDDWRGERVKKLIDTVDTQSQNLVSPREQDPARVPTTALSGQYPALEVGAVILEILDLQSQHPARLKEPRDRILGRMKRELYTLFLQVTKMLEGHQETNTLVDLERSLEEIVKYVKTADGWKKKKLITWERFEEEKYEEVIEWLVEGATDDLNELQARLIVVGRAKGDFSKATSGLKSLLSSNDWVWSHEPNQKPLKQLSLILKDLRGAEDKLKAEEIPIPVAVKQTKTFIQRLQEAARVLGRTNKRAVELFESDLAKTGSELKEVERLFAELSQEMNEQQQMLLLLEQPPDLAVNVHDYFNVEDIYGTQQMENGLVAVSVMIKDVASARIAAETRRESRELWKVWCDGVMDELDIAISSMEETSQLMKGFLFRAEERCRSSHPQESDKLRKRLNSIPGHPTCQLAQKEALKLGKYQYNLGGTLRMAWPQLKPGVNRLEICSHAQVGLEKEIGFIEEYLGKVTDQGNTSLWGKINALSKQLEGIFSLLERDLPARGKGKISSMRATQLETQIYEAEAIDRDHPRIEAYRARLKLRTQR